MKSFRSMLIMPANNPGMLIKSRAYTADAMIFDLEDAVAPMEKDAARWLLSETLKAMDFSEKTILVRINPLDVCGADDLKKIIPCKPDGVYVPKVESAQDVLDVIKVMEEYEVEGQKTPIFTIIESAKGIRNVVEIAESSNRMAGLCLGAEDYTANLGAVRTLESKEIFMARANMVIAAKSAGIQLFDTPFVDIEDKEGLRKDATYSKEMGFTGKICINPRQVGTVNEVYAPDEKEIHWAMRVIDAFDEAQANNSGVINLDGKMVDLPIVIQAQKIMEQVEAYNLK